MTQRTKLTGADLTDWLRSRSGWQTRDVPGFEISVLSHCYHDAIDEIAALTARAEKAEAEVERLRETLRRIEQMGEFPDEYSIVSASCEAERCINQQQAEKI